jgi:SpoVK/Ycf46/Vps4 family AAA+-type ATPase
MKTFAPLLLIVTLAGCGARQDLRPAAGQSAPVQPEQTSQPQTPADLLELPATARPQRVDEALTRSEERTDDRFDLPPPE